MGGGSGGHITPQLAVARKLKSKNPETNIVYVIDKGSRFIGLVEASKDIDDIRKISAGKFRRYHSDSIIKKIFDVKTNLKNLIDFFKFITGTISSVFLLRSVRPDIVFIKGGFVAVPVGLACRLVKIPYITHDSDTVPGLANRLISKNALLHTVGMPAEFYDYPKDKTRYVGIPISENYKKVSQELKKEYRKKLGLSSTDKVLCITGGSLGAVRLNHSARKIVPSLLDEFPNLQVFHQTGDRDNQVYGSLPQNQTTRIIEIPFTDDLTTYTGAADVIITRAGATTIAELAIQEKACVVVPNPELTGGHQTKNAEHLAKQNAAIVITEAELDDVDNAAKTLSKLIGDKAQQKNLATNLGRIAKTDAAGEIAQILLQEIQNRSGEQ